MEVAQAAFREERVSEESTALYRAWEIALENYREKTGKDLLAESTKPPESPGKNPPGERRRTAAGSRN